jgi:hypothetical protein
VSIRRCIPYIFLPLIVMSVQAGVAGPRGLYVNYSARPSPVDLAKAETCILDPEATIDLGGLRKPGQTFIAYVSTVEAREGSTLETMAREAGVPVLATNEHWGSKVLDVTSAAWEGVIVKMAESAAAKGYDGLFLDTVDSIHLIAKTDAKKGEQAKTAMVQLIARLREKFPTAKLVMNRGFDLWPLVHQHLDAVLVESVYQTADSKSSNYHAVSAKDSTWL